MTPSKPPNPRRSSGPTSGRRGGISPSERDLETIATRLTRRALSRHRDLAQLEPHIANQALSSLLRAKKRAEIQNVEAFLTWKINRLILDAFRRRKVYKSRFVEKPDAAHEFDEEVSRAGPQARGGVRGLSLDIINREEQEALNLAASAAVLILPDADDRALLSDWYFEGLAIAELARRHGNRQPRAMANRLARLIGTTDETGAVTSVIYTMQQLNIRTVHEFVGQIGRLHVTANLSDPMAAAIGHLELAATYSDAHRRQATLGILRMQWLQSHRPSNRGLGNKVLLRLVIAACTYVVEVNDARNDVTSEVGLHDDVNVLSAVQKAVERFAKA